MIVIVGVNPASEPRFQARTSSQCWCPRRPGATEHAFWLQETFRSTPDLFGLNFRGRLLWPWGKDSVKGRRPVPLKMKAISEYICAARKPSAAGTSERTSSCKVQLKVWAAKWSAHSCRINTCLIYLKILNTVTTVLCRLFCCHISTKGRRSRALLAITLSTWSGADVFTTQ